MRTQTSYASSSSTVAIAVQRCTSLALRASLERGRLVALGARAASVRAEEVAAAAVVLLCARLI